LRNQDFFFLPALMVPIRPRREGQEHQHAMPARLPAGPQLLSAHGSGIGNPLPGAVEANQGLEGASRPRAPGGLEKIILAFFARNRYAIDTFYIYWRDDG